MLNATVTAWPNLADMQPEAQQWKNSKMLWTLFLLPINYTKSS